MQWRIAQDEMGLEVSCLLQLSEVISSVCMLWLPLILVDQLPACFINASNFVLASYRYRGLECLSLDSEDVGVWVYKVV